MLSETLREIDQDMVVLMDRKNMVLELADFVEQLAPVMGAPTLYVGYCTMFIWSYSDLRPGDLADRMLYLEHFGVDPEKWTSEVGDSGMVLYHNQVRWDLSFRISLSDTKDCELVPTGKMKKVGRYVEVEVPEYRVRCA